MDEGEELEELAGVGETRKGPNNIVDGPTLPSSLFSSCVSARSRLVRTCFLGVRRELGDKNSGLTVFEPASDLVRVTK